MGRIRASLAAWRGLRPAGAPPLDLHGARPARIWPGAAGEGRVYAPLAARRGLLSRPPPRQRSSARPPRRSVGADLAWSCGGGEDLAGHHAWEIEGGGGRPAAVRGRGRVGRPRRVGRDWEGMREMKS